MIDAHVHVWDPAVCEYSWMTEVPQLRDRFALGDVASSLDRVGVQEVVLVQAADRPDETELLLDIATCDDRVAGVVGWVPLRDADAASRLLDRWVAGQGRRRLVGVRHMIHRDPDPDLLRSASAHEVLHLVAARDLTFDACAETSHLLALVREVAHQHPDLRIVVDHMGKPPIARGGWHPWADLMAAAAEAPNVSVKLSGLNTVAPNPTTPEHLAPYVDHVLASFGPDRVLYGSDWPFALLAARDYDEIWSPLRATLAPLDRRGLAQVLGGTARRVYRLSAH